MAKGGGGLIVNVASGAAYNYKGRAPEEFSGVPSFSYPMSKWSVVGLTKYLGGFLGPDNITVNCIARGVVMSEASKKADPRAGRELLAKEQPVPGNIDPED